MATFPARLLCDIFLWPATGLVLRHLSTLFNITFGHRIKTLGNWGRGHIDSVVHTLNVEREIS